MPAPFSIRSAVKIPAAKKAKPDSDKEIFVFDFSKKSVLLVHLDTKGADRPQVLYFTRIALPEEASADEKKELLRAKLPPIDPKSPPSVKVTWEEGMVFRQVALPDMPESDLKKALAWELKEKYFLNEDENLIGSECAVTLDADGAREKFFSVFYCDKKTAMERIGLLTGIGLHVSSLVPSQVALAQIAGGIGDGGRDALVFDIGKMSARILAVHQKRNLLSRTVLLGGQALTEMMAASFMDGDKRVQWSQEESEKVKITEGCQNPQAPYIGLVRPYLDKIVAEIKRSVDFYDGQKYAKPIAQVIFTGGGSNLKGLTGFMKSFLGLPVTTLDPEPYMSPKLLSEQKNEAIDNFGSIIAPIGAALLDNASVFNLLPREIKFEEREKTKKMWARLAVMLSVIFMTYQAVFAVLQLGVTRSKLQAANLQSREIARVLDFLKTIQADDRGMRGALKNDLPHPALMKTISRLAPGGMQFERLSFDRQTGTLLIGGAMSGGGVAPVKAIAQFIGELQKTSFFKEATLTKTTKEESGKLLFELRCQTRGLS